MAFRSGSTALLETIKVPTLIVVGEHDKPTPVAVSEDMQARIKNSKLEVIKNAGHIGNLEQPQAFNRVLLEFLERLQICCRGERHLIHVLHDVRPRQNSQWSPNLDRPLGVRACLFPAQTGTVMLMARRSFKPSSSQSRSSRDFRPLRVRNWWVDQIFLRRVGGRIVANVSLVSSQNELRTQKVFPPTGDSVDAIRITAREIARLGIVDDVSGARVRWAKESNISAQDELEEDKNLETVFHEAFRDALSQVWDDQR
jgi:alpha/beta hydrolase fold